MPRLSNSSRSDSLSPPQMPYGSPTASACERHWAITGQLPAHLLGPHLALRAGAATLPVGVEEH